MTQELLAPGIALDTSACGPGDVARFVPLFQLVWNHLPEDVRHILQSHWSTQPGSPQIRLQSFGYNSGGNARSKGHDLRFNTDLFKIMPDWCGTAVIAHELGHIFFLATNEKCHAEAETSREFVPGWACELINCELTRRWGYKQDELNEWLNCEVSDKGPYLRTTAGEPFVDPAEYRRKLASMTARWAGKQGIHGEEGVEVACRALVRSREPYYTLAVTGGGFPDHLMPSLDTLAMLLRQQSEQQEA